jgi:hypothetical protein
MGAEAVRTLFQRQRQRTENTENAIDLYDLHISTTGRGETRLQLKYTAVLFQNSVFWPERLCYANVMEIILTQIAH